MIYEGEHGGFFSKETKARTDGKKGRRPDQDFTEALIFLSEVGLIPWDHIVDETRQMHIWRCAPSVADYLGDSIPYARIDPWVGVARPIIITEARTVGGVFARTIGPEYLVPIVPTNGQTKRFLITQVAPLLDERDAHVLYGGDSDYCGDDIENNTRRVLEQYCKRSFTWGRVAITEEQREELRAAGIEPILKKDKRYKDGREHWAYEAEALGQEYLTQIFRDKLDELLPKPLKAVLVRQTKERKELAAKLKSWCQK